MDYTKPNVYYEYYRSGKEGFDLTSGDIEYRAHFHQNVEICVLISGERHVSIGGKQIHAKAPCVIFVDSFVVHSYGKGDGDHYAFVIPSEMLSEFTQMRNGRVFAEEYIQSEELVQDIMKICADYLHNKVYDGEYRLFVSANLVLLHLLKYVPLVEAHDENDGDLINRILTYIQHSYRENITLKSVAHELGYAEGHLSRVFHQYVDESFPSYVNRLRLEYVKNRLNSGENITNLIYDAGFRNAQTYYRAKKQLKKA